MRIKFKVLVNNAGQVLTYYTWATSEATAKRNALEQMSKETGLYVGALYTRLRDRMSVSEVRA